MNTVHERMNTVSINLLLQLLVGMSPMGPRRMRYSVSNCLLTSVLPHILLHQKTISKSRFFHTVCCLSLTSRVIARHKVPKILTSVPKACRRDVSNYLGVKTQKLTMQKPRMGFWFKRVNFTLNLQDRG